MSRLASLFLATAMLTAAPAFAYGQEPAAVTVRADDLDLSMARDAQRMLRRLERAADDVCGADVAQTFSGQRDEYLSCRAATLAASVRQLGADEVSALHARRYGADEVQVADR